MPIDPKHHMLYPSLPNKSKSLSLIVFQAVLCILAVEISSRLFWVVKHSVPFFSDQGLIYAFYPQIKGMNKTELTPKGGRIDILLLGGSVLHSDFGSIERILLEQLTSKIKRDVRIHNLSQPAHTSRDSYYKYKYLMDKHFNLVVFYHGINDVRANNAPPHIFRQDYSHFSWYKVLNEFDKHKDFIRVITFPHTLYYGLVHAGDQLGVVSLVPKHRPKKQWLHYGSSIKSADSFKDNLSNLLDIAKSKGEEVVVMSYAFYIPERYTKDRFESKSLDYTLHSYPIEFWGTPENVAAGISAHNAVIQEVAPKYDNVIFVDQNILIPKQGEYFNDICHLTQKGSERFVNNILDRLYPPSEQ